MNQEKVGKFITELRKEKKWTQEDLAQKLLVDRTMVSKWERGLYIPNIEYLLQLQKLFNVSINEILYGERKDLNNNNQIDALPINIMEEDRKKLKRILIVSGLMIILLLVSFFIYYFINNYNSIKVYRIYGDDKNFYINDGIMILSKEKSYIKIGNIGKYSDTKIIKTRLYFKQGDIEHNIFIGGENDTEILLINKFNYNELFSYGDIKNILKGLFLEITTDEDNKYVLNLTVYKDFANDSIINNNNIPISDGENSKAQSSIPEYIKENFVYDSDNEEYYKKTTDTKYNITETYFLNSNIYLLVMSNNELEKRFEYSLNDEIVNYYLFKGKNMIDNFSYNLKTKDCEYGSCDIQSIYSFKDDYLSKVYN